MKNILYISLLLLCVGCLEVPDPYDIESLNRLNVSVVYAEEYADYNIEEGTLIVENSDNGNSYKVSLDQDGAASVLLSNGRYRLLFSAKYSGEGGGEFFNATIDGYVVSDSEQGAVLNAVRSVAKDLVIKEIYCGGCMKTPEEGTYQFDKYIIIHNNSSEVVYLDGLCLGMVDPYNSHGTNIWISVNTETGQTEYGDDLYMVQALWRFGGDGATFPLQPGEDAVVAKNGAIDHSAQYPLSVNLNQEVFFALYSTIHFDNTNYHPAPGDKISPSRYLEVVTKLGVANAWAFSVYSPTVVLFRPEVENFDEYLLEDGVIFQKPGSTSEKIARIPYAWVEDAAEVFWGGSSSNTKRLSPVVDAGYVSQSAIYDAKSMHRRVDDEATAAAGYEVLVDTNNSSNDFYEREKASLWSE